MMDLRAASRYARALLGLARDAKKMDAVDGDLQRVREIVEKQPEITSLVLNPTISSPDKESFLAKTFGGQIEVLSIEFLKVLVRKNRFHEFAAIQESFHRAYEKEQGVQEILAISSEPLSEEAEKKLRAVLKDKLRSEIRMTAETDPAMIGGLILRFGDKEINYSYRDKLRLMKQQVIAS